MRQFISTVAILVYVILLCVVPALANCQVPHRATGECLIYAVQVLTCRNIKDLMVGFSNTQSYNDLVTDKNRSVFWNTFTEVMDTLGYVTSRITWYEKDAKPPDQPSRDGILFVTGDQNRWGHAVALHDNLIYDNNYKVPVSWSRWWRENFPTVDHWAFYPLLLDPYHNLRTGVQQ